MRTLPNTINFSHWWTAPSLFDAAAGAYATANWAFVDASPLPSKSEKADFGTELSARSYRMFVDKMSVLPLPFNNQSSATKEKTIIEVQV